MRKAQQYGREKRRHACQRVERDKQADYGKYVLGMDYYFDNLRMVIASVPSGGSVFGEMVKAYAEKNVDTTQEFARQLSQAKDLQQILQIQMAFMQAHLQAFEEEARIFGESFTKVGSSITKK